MGPFDGIQITARMLAEYYRKRAAEYDAFYADPVRQADLAVLRGWLAEATHGRRILEVAAGTGYWTAAAAPAAAAITATDINAETLAIAAARQPGAHVTLLQADAWDLPVLPEACDLGMAHLWWSHLRRSERLPFLAHLASRLRPGAGLLMIDENLVPHVGAPVARRDAAGDTWQVRRLANGERFEIIKNYPTGEELQHSVAVLCDDVHLLQLRHFWALSARFLPQPLGGG